MHIPHPFGLGKEVGSFIIMNNKNIWGKIINIVITVLTAIATTFGVTSCIWDSDERWAVSGWAVSVELIYLEHGLREYDG